MDAPNLNRRCAGVLLHVSSLPGGHGVGDIGPEAERFVDFLAAAGQSWWQMLPLVPAGAGNSPYCAPSSFAGNPWFISLDRLVEDGLLGASELEGAPVFPQGRCDYAAAGAFKEQRLRRAFARFIKETPKPHWDEFRAFYSAHAGWLEDWALFSALRERRPELSWVDWEPEIRARRFRQWPREVLQGIGEATAYHQFVQYLFDRQWRRLRAYAASKGVGLIGDVPIFVAHDSADVWANQEIFQLSDGGRPVVVAGVPPDYFSETGQLWGNPHYRWDALRSRGYDWWVARLKSAAERVDAVRLDHFIGFCNYWEIPASAKTAKEGRWVPGPGDDFFAVVTKALPELALIAEDLGSVTPEVLALRDRFGLPGMRVLQFAFGTDSQAESFLPHNYPRRTVAYTGTHDNDTVVGWYTDPGTAAGSRPRAQIEKERHNARVYLRSDGARMHWDMTEAVYRSTADTAIVPAQDLLGLGPEARMNRPGTAEGNWEWRLRPGQLGPLLGDDLRRLAEDTGRAARRN